MASNYGGLEDILDQLSGYWDAEENEWYIPASKWRMREAEDGVEVLIRLKDGAILGLTFDSEMADILNRADDGFASWILGINEDRTVHIELEYPDGYARFN